MSTRLDGKSGDDGCSSTAPSVTAARRSTSTCRRSGPARRPNGFWVRLSRSPHHRPSVISTGKNPAYNEATAALRHEGRLAPHYRHRQVKYLNNRLESDHGKLKQRIRPVRGFQSQKTAHNAIRGFETMRMFRRGQFRSMIDSLTGGSEARFIGRLFRFFFA